MLYGTTSRLDFITTVRRIIRSLDTTPLPLHSFHKLLRFLILSTRAPPPLPNHILDHPRNHSPALLHANISKNIKIQSLSECNRSILKLTPSRPLLLLWLGGVSAPLCSGVRGKSFYGTIFLWPGQKSKVLSQVVTLTKYLVEKSCMKVTSCTKGFLVNIF